MTHINLPLLIREKINDYLNEIYLSNWRSHIIICNNELKTNIRWIGNTEYYTICDINTIHYNDAPDGY
ncbi:MAG: hypothetical protein WD512_12400 [Candidatus Paceibacterota bacterium]